MDREGSSGARGEELSVSRQGEGALEESPSQHQVATKGNSRGWRRIRLNRRISTDPRRDKDTPVGRGEIGRTASSRLKAEGYTKD